jgi:serine protease
MKRFKDKYKVLSVFLLIFALLILPVFTVFAGKTQANEGKFKVRTDNFNQSKKLYSEGEVVVKFKNDNKPFRVLKLAKGMSVSEAVSVYRQKKEVEYAEPNYMAYMDMVPNDGYYKFQWHLDNSSGSGINAEEAWDIADGSGIIVAVIDTGIAQNAPDLGNTKFVAGYDFINGDADPSDDNGHGTHVAGTIAQSTNNSYGTAGVAYGAALMPLKALNKSGGGSHTAIANSIYYAANNGAHVINMSLGGAVGSDTLRNAVKYAFEKGVTIIAAAGNESSNLPHYPSSYNEYVISVGATDYNSKLSYYSNYGSDVDILAPGGDINADLNNDGYGDGVLQQTFERQNRFGFYFFQGTSMAAPHVAGAAALVLSKNNALSPDKVRESLLSGAKNLGKIGPDKIYDYKLLDAYASLSALAPVNQPPSLSIVGISDGEKVQGSIEIVVSASDKDGYISAIEIGIGDLVETCYADTCSMLWNTASSSEGWHTVSVSAKDNLGMESKEFLNVFVDNINSAPIAKASANKTSVYKDETVIFDGAGSYDEDNDELTFSWQVEGATLSVEKSFEYSFGAAGEYEIVLTVSDGEFSSSDSVAISVFDKSAVIDMYSDLTIIPKVRGVFYSADAIVKVSDEYNSPVSGAFVSGVWSGSVSGAASGYTNDLGEIIFSSNELRKAPNSNFIFTISDITKEGYKWQFE